MKAARNRTIDLTLEDGGEYLARCLRPHAGLTAQEVTDRTILGDAFGTLALLPRGIADLLIVDPPYNLDKDFGGSRFKKMSDEDYAAFTEKWMTAVLPVLKKDASVYVCCDWESSPVIGLTLKKYLRVRSRITWQREKGRGAARNWKNGMETSGSPRSRTTTPSTSTRSSSAAVS